MDDLAEGRGTRTIIGYVPAMATNLAVTTDVQQPAPGKGRVQTVMRQAAAQMGAFGHSPQPDFLHGQRVPLWPAGRERRANRGGLRADARLRGSTRRPVVVATEAWHRHA